MTNAPVVVGVDEAWETDLALPWAVTEAAARHAPLRLVTAFEWMDQYLWSNAPGYVRESDMQELSHVTDQLIKRSVARALALAPDLAIEGVAVEGSPPDVLLAESKNAAVVVVGSRQLKGLGAVVLGSVGGAVAAQAQTPVVVVRGPAGDPAEGAGVVVGVDGRSAAEAQLEYAFDHGRRHQVPVRPVLCWRPDLLASMQWRAQTSPPEPARRRLAEVTAGWQERYPDVRVHPLTIREHPVAGLVTMASTSHLLVVGKHNRGPVAGTLLGSVSQGVLHHATCPVAVIPG